jgi:histidinol-phosphate phosphatase family protein
MIKTVFLDRDGVINVHIPKGYVTKIDELSILPGVGAAIKRLNEAGIQVAIISNQQGVAKGLMTSEALTEVDEEMRKRLWNEDKAEITRSYYCVHHRDDGCECRKPKGGQLRNAARDLSIDLAESIFIGDSPTDIQAGRDGKVGQCALVLSGATKSFVRGKWHSEPDSVHRDLTAAIDWVLFENL